MVRKVCCCCCLFVFPSNAMSEHWKYISAILLPLPSRLQDGCSVFMWNICTQFIAEARNRKQSGKRIFCLTAFFSSSHSILLLLLLVLLQFKEEKIFQKPSSRLHLMLLGQNQSLEYTSERDYLSDIKGYPPQPTSKTYDYIYKEDARIVPAEFLRPQKGVWSNQKVLSEVPKTSCTI